jgi:hypothetical protein
MAKKQIIVAPNPPALTVAEEEELEAGGFTRPNINELDTKIKNQLSNFGALLDTISSVEDKTKALWKHIFENAVQDRKNAYIMWIDLYGFVHANPNEHAIHGQNLSRYMERMSKANDQILKLTELVSRASEEQVDAMTTEESIYDNIQKMNINGEFKQ